MIRQHDIPGPVHYWEFLWNAMRQLGWSLSHFAFHDESTGANRHLVRARRDEQEVICSAPELKAAVQQVFLQTRTSGPVPKRRVPTAF